MNRVARSTWQSARESPLALLADTIQPFPTFSEAFCFAPAERANRIRAGA